jgi:hypothetical protein
MTTQMCVHTKAVAGAKARRTRVDLVADLCAEYDRLVAAAAPPADFFDHAERCDAEKCLDLAARSRRAAVDGGHVVNGIRIVT